MVVARAARREMPAAAARMAIPQPTIRTLAAAAAVTAALEALAETRGIQTSVLAAKAVRFFPPRSIVLPWAAEEAQALAITLTAILWPVPARPAAASSLFEPTDSTAQGRLVPT